MDDSSVVTGTAIAFLGPLVGGVMAVAMDRVLTPAAKLIKNSRTAKALAKVDNWLTPRRARELLRLMDILGLNEEGAIATVEEKLEAILVHGQSQLAKDLHKLLDDEGMPLDVLKGALVIELKERFDPDEELENQGMAGPSEAQLAENIAQYIPNL